jgi:AcrR family transcriptional regulator
MPTASAGRKQQVIAEFRRAEILLAAQKIFASKGFDATRMEEIAKAARLAKGTLYRYFRSKDAVYQATVQQALDKLADLTDAHVQAAPDFASKLAAFISVRIAFWHEHQQLYRIILSINRQGTHRKRSIAWQRDIALYLESLFKQAALDGVIPEQDFLEAAWTAVDLIRGINERRAFAFTAEERPANADAAFLTRFLLSALQARPGAAAS